jgi:uncharacterized membrane protein
MSWWDWWLWELGFAICHQHSERLLRFGDRALFVCARDTGLFVSFFTVLLVLSLLRGRDRGGMPPWPVMALAVCGLLFFGWDGLTSYLGFRESGNTLRFASGFAAGAGLAFLVAAFFNRTVFGADNSLRVGARSKDLLAVCLAGGATAAFFLYRPQPLFRFGQLWLMVCILGTFWSLNLLLVCLIWEKEGRGFSWPRAAVALLLTALELAGSYTLHRVFKGEGPTHVRSRRKTGFSGRLFP